MTAAVSNFTEPHFGTIPLACVFPSKTNPRKHFDQAALHELAESIKQVGLAQPILVRPLPTTENSIDCVEIVAGERRYRASKLAGLERIPAIVRELTDAQVRKIQIIENLQRQDVHPIEEAEGYELLMKEDGYTADQLAGEVGKSKAYIYGRLKLCVLVPAARDAFFGGKISASIAEKVARIPVASLQQKATEEIIHNQGQKEPMSFRRAAEHIEARYMLTLTEAPFAVKDAKLVPSVGSCWTCPKRTGNQPELYQDVDADVCTDPDCFASKRTAHNERKLAAIQKTGLPMLDVASAHTEMREKGLTPGYTSLRQFERAATDKGYKSIAEALPADKLPKPVAYIKNNNGEFTEVFEKSSVQLALEKAGLCLTLEQHNAQIQEKLSGEARNPKLSEKEQQERAALKERTAKAVQESAYRVALYKAIREQLLQGKGQLEALREAAKIIATEWCFPSEVKDLYSFNPLDDRQAATFLDTADLGQVIVYLLDIAIGSDGLHVNEHDVRDNDYMKPSHVATLSLASVCDVDAAALRSEAIPAPQDEAKAAKKTQPKAAAKPKKEAATKADKAVPAHPAAAAWPFPTTAKKAAAKPPKEKAKDAAPANPAAAAWPFPAPAQQGE
jgi:ParB/RepB/Spo0J family partition protein